MSKVVGIFTGKDLNMMELEGGSGYWVARSDRIRNSDYVILMRNRRAQWAAKDGKSHGQAFMIGKVSGCIASQKYNGRKVIQMSEYSLLPDTDDFKKAWKKLTKGQRYPVAYLNTDDLLEDIGLDVNTLEWSIFNANPIEDVSIDDVEDNDVEHSLEVDASHELPDVVAEAKEMIAEAAGVDIDQVEVRINF